MANDIQTIKNAQGVVAKMAAAMLANKCTFSKTIDKADASDFDGVNGYNSGDTIYVNKPARFIPSSNADITSDIQDVKEEKVGLTLDIRKVVPVALTSKDIATELSLKSWAKRILEPAMSSMAQHVEKELLTRAVDATYNTVGSPGSSTYDTDMVLQAGQKIDENACPDYDNRFALLNPEANRLAVGARKGLFNAQDEVAKQYKNGAMGKADGFTFLRNNLLPLVLNGNDVAFEVSTTVSTEGATSVVVEGLTTTTGTVKQGQVIKFAGVNAVDPITKEDLGYEQEFVVQSDATADGSGIATLSILPAIYTSASGSLQSVTAFPADGDAITTVGSADGSYKQSLFYHKSAFRMVSVPLIKPDGTDLSAQETVDGYTVRVIRDYDVLTDKMIMRLDFLGGFAATRPEWSTRGYN